MKWYHWVWLPLSIALAVVGFALTRRGNGFAPAIKAKLDEVDARQRAKRAEAEKGFELARLQIESEHRATIEKLDTRKRERADRLRNDLPGLAAFLTRLGQ